MPEYNIKQIVPPSWCFTCEVCCRFPKKESFLAPYFTSEEIIIAKTLLDDGGRLFNPPRSNFSEYGSRENNGFKTGCKITLYPYKEGYICPAFDPVISHCKIYDHRPVDCMLYPFAIMWNETDDKVILGVDKKCPFITSHIGDNILRKASDDIASIIESSPLLDIIISNKELIGPYQEDVVPLIKLAKFTDMIISASRGTRS